MQKYKLVLHIIQHENGVQDIISFNFNLLAVTLISDGMTLPKIVFLLCIGAKKRLYFNHFFIVWHSMYLIDVQRYID
jgi:hypothetical protein